MSPIDWDNDDDGDDDGPGVCEACGVPFAPGTHYLHVELMLDESQSEEETLTLCHAHTTAAEAIIHACEERRGEDEDDVIEDGYARVVLTRAADDFERSWVICGEHAQELFDLQAKVKATREQQAREKKVRCEVETLTGQRCTTNGDHTYGRVMCWTHLKLTRRAACSRMSTQRARTYARCSSAAGNRGGASRIDHRSQQR